jgi:hypothetical protein
MKTNVPLPNFSFSSCGYIFVIFVCVMFFLLVQTTTECVCRSYYFCCGHELPITPLFLLYTVGTNRHEYLIIIALNSWFLYKLLWARITIELLYYYFVLCWITTILGVGCCGWPTVHRQIVSSKSFIYLSLLYLFIFFSCWARRAVNYLIYQILLVVPNRQLIMYNSVLL